MDVDLDHRGQSYHRTPSWRRLLETTSDVKDLLSRCHPLPAYPHRLHSSPPSLATPVRLHASQLMQLILD